MQVRHESRVIPDGEEIRIQIPRFKRRESQARGVGFMQDVNNQVAYMPAKFLSPRAEMYAGQHDLFCAASQRELNIRDHLLHRTTAPCTTRHGGDAKSAMIVAAILHFNKCPGTTVQTGERL